MSVDYSYNKNWYYRLYPRIFKVGEEASLTLAGRYKDYELPAECVVRIIGVSQFKNQEPYAELVAPVHGGCLTFSYTFEYEQKYLLRLFNREGQDLNIEFAVYALEPDLFYRRPYKGDLHIHTIRTDGMETPQHMICACREHGLDFIAIADHNRYESSLEAIDELIKLPVSMVALKGEEVHAGAANPKKARSPVHILSLDADYAIAPFTSFTTDEEYDAAFKAFDEDFEELAANKPWLQALGQAKAKELLATTKERRARLLLEFSDSTQLIDAEAYVYALDVCEHIKQAGGMSVLSHSQWQHIPFGHFSQRDDVPLELMRRIVNEMPYDVYEVVSYYSKEESGRNLWQVQLLAEAGHWSMTPVIGITDTHTTLPGWSELGNTYSIIFARELSTAGLKEGLLGLWSVAVEDYDGVGARCYGQFRLSHYADFLIDEYYPARDERCRIESAFMYHFYEVNEAAAEYHLREICPTNKQEEELWWAQ
ncbi:MAG: hypothetical protein FWE41_08860 [Coriobacteriia bacterium]|nr:hypothetical protein [Coriobacteriia bacterium]